MKHIILLSSMILLFHSCNSSYDEGMHGSEVTFTDELVEQTVLIVYTPKSREIAISLSGSIELHSQELVDATNEAYERSSIKVRLAIADVRFIDYNFTEEVILNNPNANSITAITALVDPNDGIVDEIHDWRDEVNADIAILKNNFCGGSAAPCQTNFVAEFLGFPEVDGAFALAGDESCPNNPFTFAHEIGHLQGCNHQPGFGATNPDAEYANGFVSQAGRFRTIMATSSTDRVGIFSSPDVFWEGFVTGTAEQNDCVRGINETAEKIAAFR